MLSFSSYSVEFAPFWVKISEQYSSQGNASINLVVSLHDHSRDCEAQTGTSFRPRESFRFATKISYFCRTSGKGC